MTTPTATYRLQFRNGMTFDRAAGLVPYLKRLGISHLYASPIFTATSGSTHGYDITDANEIDPEIGGREGFDRMVAALKDAGLGLILDIVPNHMAASLENRWWRDVVEHGEKSRYARHFDIDWSRRLTLPFLGDTFEQALEAGDIAITANPATGKPVIAYYETFYPLSPDTYQGRDAEVLGITAKAAIAAMHDRQPYRLTSWRDAPRDLSYRRFFEITGLAGVRVEDDAVFDDTHRLILDLVRSGVVDGLRVDHVDGLADPKAYLERLHREAGPDCYITVEKILGEGEHLPEDWPVSGTTGYEFISALSDVFVDDGKIGTLRDAYEDVVGHKVDMASELRDAKLLMANNNFAGEFATLSRIATEILKTDDTSTPLEQNSVEAALRELLVAFPVYRTYGTAAGLGDVDRERLEAVIEVAASGPGKPERKALDALQRILTGEVADEAKQQAALFRTRFQQLTGPLMAKSIEDTLFFRQHMLLALNEVGADPLPRTFSIARFHAEMQERAKRQPDGLSGTSTHDTKRGEDARARLYALSEAPDVWAAAVERWRAMNSGFVTTLDDGPAPESSVEWMIYQALAGAWPTDLSPTAPDSLRDLEERFLGYVEKSLREAKLRTNWGDSDEAYESAVLDYARALLSPANGAFLTDFAETVQPFVEAGWRNSIAQTIIKLTAPGVPDIYQGSEWSDFSLVDPDNRREPDFAALQRSLPEQSASLPDNLSCAAQMKQQVVQRLLHLRLASPSLFRKGSYLPLDANDSDGRPVVAFARILGDDAIVVVAAAHALREETGGHDFPIQMAMPDTLMGRLLSDILEGGTPFQATGKFKLELRRDRPFAVFRSK